MKPIRSCPHTPKHITWDACGNSSVSYNRDNRIKLEDCQHRKLYKLIARNISIGVFDEETKEFYGIREKFGSRYVSGESHWDGLQFKTACPMEIIGELPDSIPLYESSPELYNWLEIQLMIHAEWTEAMEDAKRAETQARTDARKKEFNRFGKEKDLR